MTEHSGNKRPVIGTGGLQRKLLVALGGSTLLLMVAMFAGLAALVQEVRRSNDGYTAALSSMNQSLQDDFVALEDELIALPKSFEIDPTSRVVNWATSTHDATAVDHVGRDALVARYTKRSARRDVQKPGRFVVEETAEGVSVSYGLPDPEGGLSDTVRELKLAATDAETIKAEVERISEEANNPAVLIQQIRKLTDDLVERALDADRRRGEQREAMLGLLQEKARVEGVHQLLFLGMIGAGLAGLLVLLVTLISVSRRVVVRPLTDLTDAWRGVLQDREAPIPHTDRTDEIGQLARAVEAYRDGAVEQDRLTAHQREAEAQRAERVARIDALVAGFETEVSAILERVGNSGLDLTRTSEAMATAAENGRGRTEAMASAAAESFSNVQSIAAASEQLTQAFGAIDGQVAQSGEIAEQARSGADGAMRQAQSLLEVSDRINAIIQLIDDIASQTNLLALNASIEAARAGEAGKGFAVVAGEVKSLANQTSNATAEIADQVRALQTASQQVADGIENVASVVARMGEIGGTIGEAIGQQSSSTRGISANIREAAARTEQVSGDIESVSGITRETGAAAEQMRGVASAFRTDAEALRGRIERFLGEIRTA